MSTIKMHVFWEVLKAFLLVMAVTTLIMTLGGGAKQGLEKGLPPYLIAQIIPYVLPEMLRFTIPGCLLFAVCTVFGRMSGANEIFAVKAAGVHPMAIVWPVLVLAYVLSLATYSLYDACAVWGRPGLRRTVVESAADIAYGVLRTERAFQAKNLTINVKGVDRRTLLQPIILIQGDKNRPTITLKAEEAELEADAEAGVLRIRCHNGELKMDGKATLSFEDTIEHVVPFDRPAQANPDYLSPAGLSSSQIPGQIEREKKFVAKLQRRQADGTGDREKTARELERHKLRLYRLQTETARRWSNGFSCLFFALIGVAVATSWRLTDTVTIFFVCFLPILLLYYPLLVVGEHVSTKGMLPSWAVWLPNLALGALGIGLMRRVIRY